MIDRIKNIFLNSEIKPDIILLKNSDEPYIDYNFFYLTNITKGLFEGSLSIIFPDGNIDLIVPELEYESAKNTIKNVFTYKTKEEFYNILKNKIKSYKKIGINFNGITLSDFYKLEKNIPNIDFIDVSKSFDKTRLIKDKFEIDIIKKACNIADKVVSKLPNLLTEQMTEYELAAEIDYLLVKNGADKPGFETISSFGKNTSEPHYSHGETKLKKGDFIVCDFGANYKKYNSDITRTFVFGKASKEQKEMYETVINAQQLGFDLIKDGAKSSEIHDAVCSYIDKTQFKGRFIHSTGHSLGMYVHDGERISSNSELILKENMVFTVEPGIYVPNFGGVRIEDDVIIKKNGIEILTKSTRELLEI